MSPARSGVFRWMLVLLVHSCCIAAGDPQSPAPQRHVILVSVDGLLPTFYLPGPRSQICPTLTRLRESGAAARRVRPVYPSLTYPGHASMVTGVHPARHGIIANTLFTPPQRHQRGAWFAEDLQSPALWELTHARGLTAAAVFWPVSAGAEGLAWNLPEFWTSSHGSENLWMRRFTTPSLWNRLSSLHDDRLIDQLHPVENRDALAVTAALEILRAHQPHLLLLHLMASDKVQHRYGRAAPELDPVMRTLDGYIARLWEEVIALGMAEKTVLMVLGDHGFRDVDRMIGLNVLLLREGLITLNEEGEVAAWSAMIHATGTSAGVYLNDHAPAEDLLRVSAILEDYAVDERGLTRYTLIPADHLAELGGPPGAAFYLEGGPGVMLSSSFHPAFLERRASLRGNHGGLPDDLDLATGLVCAGAGIRVGVMLDTVNLVDIAPTIAALLGMPFPDTDGRVLTELMEEMEEIN